jgi:predicted O-methyltransferase YrrM
MALPALKIVHAKLRPGAIIVTDNTTVARSHYKDLFAYIHDPANSFRTMTTPFSGGLEVTVYLPSASS